MTLQDGVLDVAAGNAQLLCLSERMAGPFDQPRIRARHVTSVAVAVSDHLHATSGRHGAS
jgi:hypothetical protein